MAFSLNQNFRAWLTYIRGKGSSVGRVARFVERGIKFKKQKKKKDQRESDYMRREWCNFGTNFGFGVGPICQNTSLFFISIC
jgi:hypothetical protein